MALPRNELVAALIGAFDAITFDRMLSDHLNIRRERLVAATGLAGLDAIVSKMVEIADEQRFVIELIRAALAANPGSPKLQEFIARNPAYDPSVQKLQTYSLSAFMKSGRVFCKRDDLRQNLRQIGALNQSRVLAIDGDRYTGKTYSREFLNFLRENEPSWSGEQREIYVNMDDCVFEPEDLARIVGGRLGINSPMPPETGEQAPRRIPALVEWLANGLDHSAARVWWLILDGFRIQVQPSATHDFIRALIDVVDRDQDKVRMILLNYKEFLDLDIGTFILREEIEPIDEKSDLQLFFRHVYTLSKRTFVEDDIETTIENVRKQVDEEVAKRGTELRMRILSRGLTIAAKNLLT